MAGCVDNVDLLEIPVQEMSADCQDVTATTIVLFHCYRLRQPRARNRCTAAVKRRKKTGHTNQELKQKKLILDITVILCS